MQSDEIRSNLVHLLSETLGADPEQLTNATYIEDIAADSLEVTQLVMEIEAKFGLEIADRDAEAFKTIGDVVRFLEIKKNPRH